MGEGLALFVRDWGAGSLVALVVVMVLTGWLVPKPRHNREISLIEQSKDEALEREAHYRDIVERQLETIRLQTKQLEELMEHAETSVALLEAIESRACDHRAGSSASAIASPGVADGGR